MQVSYQCMVTSIYRDGAWPTETLLGRFSAQQDYGIVSERSLDISRNQLPRAKTFLVEVTSDY
jgi:hypothetical protein